MKVYIRATDPLASELVQELRAANLHVVNTITDRHDAIIVDSGHAAAIPGKLRHKTIVFCANKNPSPSGGTNGRKCLHRHNEDAWSCMEAKHYQRNAGSFHPLTWQSCPQRTTGCLDGS